MLKEERQQLILKEIDAANKVYSGSLSKKLDVSEDTIRRDLNELADGGHIKKVHGGAMAVVHPPEIIKNHGISSQNERQIIAQKAASMISNGNVVIIEGDSTNVLVVDYLPRDLSATIFTNSLLIASKLYEYNRIETIFLGGQLSRRSKVTVGMDVINSLMDVHADLCLIEASSVHDILGMTEGDREKALTKKAMIKSSLKVVALCLSSSIGRMEPFKIDELSKIDVMITELKSTDYNLNLISNKGVILV